MAVIIYRYLRLDKSDGNLSLGRSRQNVYGVEIGYWTPVNPIDAISTQRVLVVVASSQ